MMNHEPLQIPNEYHMWYSFFFASAQQYIVQHDNDWSQFRGDRHRMKIRRHHVEQFVSGALTKITTSWYRFDGFYEKMRGIENLLSKSIHTTHDGVLLYTRRRVSKNMFWVSVVVSASRYVVRTVRRARTSDLSRTIWCRAA